MTVDDLFTASVHFFEHSCGVEEPVVAVFILFHREYALAAGVAGCTPVYFIQPGIRLQEPVSAVAVVEYPVGGIAGDAQLVQGGGYVARKGVTNGVIYIKSAAGIDPEFSTGTGHDV